MWFYKEGCVIDESMQREMIERMVEEARKRIGGSIKRALLLPPDLTRYHSGSGMLTHHLYHTLGPDCYSDVIPTLGQHVPHTPEENRWMFGDIPQQRIHAHDWQNSCEVLGEVSKEFAQYATDGKVDWGIPVEINKAVKQGGYDFVFNIGQVVPHEVLGFANHNKNYFIGLGGQKMICASHISAATYGIENNLGQMITPLRGCYNVAERDCLSDIADVYVLLVKTRDECGQLVTSGFYVGDDIETYVRSARYTREHTVNLFDKPHKKVVCYMDDKEFRSTWVSNKAIYRNRMAVADGGELIVIAPGVERFGEQKVVDQIIRKYGYKGTPVALDAYKNDPVVADMGHAAAHLIHGSSEGRFTITYAPGKLRKEEVEQVGFNYMDPAKALELYNPNTLKDGINTVQGEEIYYVSSPSMGLWAARDKFVQALNTNLSFAEKMCRKEPDEPIWKQLKQWDEEDLEKYNKRKW
jgi:nickel-dependent lactate racemase